MQCIFSASKVERMIWFVCKLKWKVCNKVECVHRSWLSFSMQQFSAVQTEDMTSPSTPRNFSFTWISSIWFWFLQQIKSRHAVGTRMHRLELSKPLISKTSHLLAMRCALFWAMLRIDQKRYLHLQPDATVMQLCLMPFWDLKCHLQI